MLNRRAFIRICTTSSAGLMLACSPLNMLSLTQAGATPNQRSSRVAIIRRPDVWQGGRPSPGILKDMLNHGVQFLTGQSDLPRSWGFFFSARDRVAMKVNPIARQTGSTRPELCSALGQALNENVGIPFERMVVFDVSAADLKGAGFLPREQGHTIPVRQTEAYSSTLAVQGVQARVSRIITDECTALINVPLLKTHKSAGLSVALKNHYGSIPTEMVRGDAYRYHMDRFKNLVFLNMMPPIRDKQRLIVVDGLEAQYNRGPGGDPRFQWTFNGIIMGCDPVAVETVCLGIINKKRVENGLSPLSLPYLDWARQEGLGTNVSREIVVYETV